MDMRHNDDSNVFGLSSQKNEIAFPEIGKTMGEAAMGKIKYMCKSADTVSVNQLTFSEYSLCEEHRDRYSQILLVKCSC